MTQSLFQVVAPVRGISARVAFAVIALLSVAGVGLGEAVEVWAPEVKLVPDGISRFESDGYPVRVEGDVLALGASRYDTDGPGFDQGAVIIYLRDSDGVWVQSQLLLGSDIGDREQFGGALSIDGDRLAVGAEHKDSAARWGGAAYLFERQADDNWVEVAALQASDVGDYDRFGSRLSIDGDRLAVSATGWDSADQEAVGRVYLFERDQAGGWGEVASVSPGDAGFAYDRFGTGVALDGDRLIVGADGAGSGAVYVYGRQSDGQWLELEVLRPSDSPFFAYFGNTLALDGNTLVVGAYGVSNLANDAGAVYVFDYGDGTGWQEVQKIDNPEPHANDYFSIRGIALEGELLAVPVHVDGELADEAGAVYLYQRDESGHWSGIDKIMAWDGTAFNRFGSNLAFDRDRLVATAEGTGEQLITSLYVFEPALVEPSFELVGSCPGQVTLSGSGLTPLGNNTVFFSFAEGLDTVGGGPCEGTELLLEEANPFRFPNADFDGFGQVTRTVDEFHCGALLQLLDRNTCTTSGLVFVP